MLPGPSPTRRMRSNIKPTDLIGSIILKPDRNSAATKIVAALYRALALVELHVPADVQGAFIGVGNAHDAFAAIGKVIGEATADILIVDPYMDANTLSEYVAQAREGVPARLLTDDKSCKPAIRPAVTTWRRQHGNARPVALRTTAPGVLHDRLIFVDQKTAWMLTQSLNAFAARSPGTLVRSGADVQDAKIAAYRSILIRPPNLNRRRGAACVATPRSPGSAWERPPLPIATLGRPVKPRVRRKAALIELGKGGRSMRFLGYAGWQRMLPRARVFKFGGLIPD